MPGRNTDSHFRKDDGIDSGEMNSTRSGNPSFPAKVASSPGNPIDRLEDEMQNSSLHMEILNKNGNSIAPKCFFDGDKEKHLPFTKQNDIYHQEWTTFQQGGGEEDNAVFMRNVMKSLKISEETSNLAGIKMELSKFIDSHVFQTEKVISEIQNVVSGDPHLGTSRLGCLATSSPENKPQKNGASRELRRASLIPPHGANRFKSSFMSRESHKVRSVIFPTGANRFLSVSSAGGFTKSQSCKEQQVDCSNHAEESCTLMVKESSKAGESSHLQTGMHDINQYCEEKQCGLDNTIAGDGHIEVKAKKGTPMNNIGEQDLDMIDSVPFGFYNLKNSTNEPDEPQFFQNEMEVQHVDEKGIQRDFKIEAEINANFSNPLVQSEAKGKGVQSKFKNDYKRKTVFSKFRKMNNLARISSMREGIIACRRSSCVASTSVSHICSSQKGGDESRGPCMVDHIEGNATNNKSETKISVFGKKRFLEKALIDSAKRLQAHKMLRSGVYDGLSVEKEETAADNNREDNSSKDVHQAPLNIVECESESYGESMIEQKRRRREQFKKPLVGKSREKTKEIAERVALFQRSQILQSKRGNMSLV